MNKRVAGIPAPAQSLTDLAYAHLEELIVTLKLRPGAVVSEGELSVLTGIGRTPIREALQRLARERLVSILPRRGIIVSEINVKSQLRLLEVQVGELGQALRAGSLHVRAAVHQCCFRLSTRPRNFSYSFSSTP